MKKKGELRRCSERDSNISVTTMVGEKRSRTYYWRKCKREKGGRDIDSLPDELLLEILARISDDPDHLYKKARAVCPRWRRLIQSQDFIKTQLHRSTYGLVLDHATFVSATHEGGQIKTSKIPPSTKKTWSSCNGVGLVHQGKGKCMIGNPVTRQQLVLPSFTPTNFVRWINGMGCGIGYGAKSMVYKVVSPFITVGWEVCIGIRSVGIDECWRVVGAGVLSSFARSLMEDTASMGCSSSEGLITWSNYRCCAYLTLDVETEILTRHPCPRPRPRASASCTLVRHFYLSTGRSLSLLVVHWCTDYLVELWEMKAESGEWRKVMDDIKLGDHTSWLQEFPSDGPRYMRLLGWVRYPEVLALCFRRGGTCCFFYNLITHQISFMHLPRKATDFYTAHPHKKTLTCLL